MNLLTKILREANVGPNELANAVGMSMRAINYHYSTGRMPYALVYKMHLVTGIPLDVLVPKYLAEQWLFMFEQQVQSAKPRGFTSKTWKGNKELDEPVSRETIPAHNADIHKTPLLPSEATPLKPKPATKKKSISDIMKATPPQPAEPDVDAPDFSGLDDSVFQTSMDPSNTPVKKKR